MNKNAIALGIISIAFLATIGTALASKTVSPASQWKILDRVQLPNGGWNFLTRHPSVMSDGSLTFPFLTDTGKQYTNYMLENYNKDLTGTTITAEVAVTGDPSAFGYNICGGASAGTSGGYVRIEFQDTAAGPYNETDYWWSHAASTDLMAALSGNVTLTADTTNLADWSDINGHFASDPGYTDGFYHALANAKEISFSFGGGSCYANGVAVESGSASFVMHSLTIS